MNQKLSPFHTQALRDADAVLTQIKPANPQTPRGQMRTMPTFAASHIQNPHPRIKFQMRQQSIHKRRSLGIVAMLIKGVIVQRIKPRFKPFHTHFQIIYQR
jgi:hypothetical protein